MRAGQLVGRGRFAVDRFPVPPLSPGAVLLRTRLASICGSDLHIAFETGQDGDYPLPPGFPGHESVCEVLESRSDLHRPGDLVLATPSPGQSCAFADLQVVAGPALVPLPDEGTPLETLLMAQQLGTVVFALKRFWTGPPAETAAVIGAGTAGLHFTQILRGMGFGRVIVADRHAHRLEAARSVGAGATVLAPGESIVDATLDLTGGRGADLVIEAVGRDATRVQALLAVADSGRVGFFGLPERDGDMPLPFAEVFRRRPTIEISVGTQEEPGLASFREAVRRIGAGEVDVSKLVTHRFGIERLQDAVDLARDPSAGALKVAIEFD